MLPSQNKLGGGESYIVSLLSLFFNQTFFKLKRVREMDVTVKNHSAREVARTRICTQIGNKKCT